MKTSSPNVVTADQIAAHCRRLGLPLPAGLEPKPVSRPVTAEPTEPTEGTVTALSVTIILRTVSEANVGGSAGLASKLGRKKRQRTIVRELLQRMPGLPALPVKVTMTRLGRKLLDSDNIATALKAVRDGIADAFGVDDGSPLYEWVPAQEVGGKVYAVRISIEARASE